MSVAEIFKLHGENFFRKKEVSQQSYACMSSMYFIWIITYVGGSCRKVSHYFPKMSSITVQYFHDNIFRLSGLNFFFNLNLILGHNAFYLNLIYFGFSFYFILNLILSSLSKTEWTWQGWCLLICAIIEDCKLVLISLKQDVCCWSHAASDDMNFHRKKI